MDLTLDTEFITLLLPLHGCYGNLGRCFTRSTGEMRCIKNYTEKADNLYVKFQLIKKKFSSFLGGAMVVLL